MIDDIYKTGKNTPAHLFRPNAIYMLTGAIYKGQFLLQSSSRKQFWEEAFHKAADIHHWSIIAWVVLDNHYHAMLRAPENAVNLPTFISSYHKFTARKWNAEEHAQGRKVWWNYWDTCVRSEKDFMVRLKYIYWNPVKHGLVGQPENYPFSNYNAFLAGQGSNVFALIYAEVDDVPEF
jgi:putative transposase